MAVFNWVTTAPNVTPGTTGSYQDVDLDDYVASLGDDVTGVILQVFGTGGAFGARKNGSTDNRNYTIANGAMVWAMVGVDASHIFEVNAPAASTVYLVGYTKTGVTFHTNAVDKSLSSTDSWVDTDCSANAPDAVGLIFECQNNYSASGSFGWRKNGSSDARLFGYSLHQWIITGCDGSQVCEQYVASTSMDAWLVGYVTTGATFNTNGVDKSATTTGSYQDRTCSNDATGVFLEWGQDNYTYAVRPNGASYDYVKQCYYHPWSLCGTDENYIVEVKISSTNVDCWEVGFSTAPAGGNTYEMSCSDGFKAGEPTVKASLSINLSLTEGLTGVDSSSGSKTVSPSLSEGIAIADALSHLYQSNPSIADGLKAGDGVSTQVLLNALAQDAIKAGDSPLTQAVLNEILTDGLNLSDTVLAGLLYLIVVTDGLTGGDTAISQLISNPALVDALKAGESPITQVVLQNTLADGFKAGDAASIVRILQESVTEGLTLSDETVSGLLYQLSLTDGFETGDAVALYLTLVLQLSDTLKSGDTPVSQAVMATALTEGIKAGDIPLAQLIAQAIITDGFDLSDTPSIGSIYLLTLTDGIAAGENLSSQLTSYPVLTEGFKFSETLATQLTTNPSLIDGFAAGDTASVQAIFNALASEGLTMTDAAFHSTLGRILKIASFTAKYRDIKAMPAGYRRIQAIASLYRLIKSLTSGGQ